MVVDETFTIWEDDLADRTHAVRLHAGQFSLSYDESAIAAALFEESWMNQTPLDWRLGAQAALVVFHPDGLKLEFIGVVDEESIFVTACGNWFPENQSTTERIARFGDVPSHFTPPPFHTLAERATFLEEAGGVVKGNVKTIHGISRSKLMEGL